MSATRRAASFIGGLVCAALVPAASLVPAAAPVGAEPSDGLHACDYRRDYDGIPCREVDRAISESAAEFRTDEVELRRIVRCESRFDPRAEQGGYKGLFQQVARYWDKRVADFNEHHNPDVGGDIYSPFDNARVSSRMIAAGMQEHWPNCA
jgi:hypothetical protein